MKDKNRIVKQWITANKFELQKKGTEQYKAMDSAKN